MKLKNEFISVIVISLITVFLASMVVSQHSFANTIIENKQIQTFNQCDFIGSFDEIEPTIFDNYAKEHDVRITIIAFDGKILYDSETDPAKMDNHYYRDEVKQLRETGRGVSIRHSNTTNIDTIYCAINSTNNKYIVRVASPYKALSIWNSKFVNSLLPVMAMIVLITIFLSFLIMKLLLKPIDALVKAGEEYSTGNLKYKSYITKPQEISKLSNVLNNMSKELDQKIITIYKEKNEYYSILKSINEGIILLDKNNNIILSNSSAREMLSFKEKKNLNLVNVSKEPKFFEYIDATLKGKTKKNKFILEIFGEYQGERARLLGNGKQKTYNVIISPVKAPDDSIVGTVITLIDVTEVKKLEQIRTDFVSNVSHELKTPLTSLIGFTEILSKEDLDKDEIQRFSSIIYKNSKQMKSIVDDLLILASLENQQKLPHFEKTDLKALIFEAEDSVKFKADEKNIEIINKNTNEFSLYCNYNLIKQVIINLLTNAINYSNENTQITIDFKKEINYVKIMVSDNGCGIPEEHLDRIFERFYRVDKARSRAKGGTGLGLSIVKHICLLHKGSVNVESKVNKGTTFTITLPIKLSELNYLEEKSEILNKK